jgi:D-3-phosphoglycerate dehydrogenase
VKIVVTDYIEDNLDWEAEELAKEEGVVFEAHQLKFVPVEELLEKIRDADVILVNMVKMTPEVIGALEKCQLIIRHGVGYDNVDIAAATARGIRVGYVPDYCANEVAEQAVALILACWRKVFPGRKLLENCSAAGKWDFEPIYPIHSLSGKTVGIVGCGRIGSLVLKKLSGFDVHVLICDPYLSEERQQELGVTPTDLDTVLSEADVITLHVPLTNETRRFISEPQLRRMKETAYLINTSRAGALDTEAVCRALRENWIAGAGIDVYDKEPPDPELELFRLENATLSPHLGWYSEEAGWSIREKILEDFRRFLSGQPPRFLINPEVGRR